MRRIIGLLLALMMALLSGCSMAEAVEQPRSGVTYEIFVASFADSDGDGCGDLQGIISRLDYIEQLGVSRVWLMPVSPSPSYHKYDVVDYYAIDPAYGTMADFDALTAACHARGIDVIIDLVVNHTSSEHPWFKEACAALAQGIDNPFINWYNFTQGTGQHPVPGADGWFYEGQFVYSMPDLNLDNPDVRTEIAGIIAFWQAHGVDGFRLDACTSYYTGSMQRSAEFVRFVCDTARAGDPDCYIVGEVWDVQSTILTMYGSGIDSLFNFPAADQDGRFLKSAMNGTGAACAAFMADWNDTLHAVNPAALDAPFLTNHDLSRVRGMLRSDVTKMKTAAMLYLLMPGAPFVYYGEELGMGGSGKDENKRQAMLWSASDKSRNCASPEGCDQAQKLKAGVDEQDEDETSLLNTYRAVIALRAQAPELLHGQMTALEAGNDAVCFFRVDEGSHAVAVLVNAGDAEVTVDVAQLFQARVIGSVGDVETPGEWLTPMRSDRPDASWVKLGAASCILLRIEP